MKLVFRYFIFINLIIGLGCTTNPSFPDSDNDTNSDCQKSNHELICWTIIDDISENTIAGAFGNLDYGTGPLEYIQFGSTDSGSACFCFPIEGVILSGFIRAEGYEQMDMTDLRPSEINIIRLIPLN